MALPGDEILHLARIILVLRWVKHLARIGKLDAGNGEKEQCSGYSMGQFVQKNTGEGEQESEPGHGNQAHIVLGNRRDDTKQADKPLENHNREGHHCPGWGQIPEAQIFHRYTSASFCFIRPYRPIDYHLFSVIPVFWADSSGSETDSHSHVGPVVIHLKQSFLGR